ncbi:MAG: hypothetical protein KY453_11520 [Gemmatimonadetes bacterium]|nr:hypothetical protein [Gemmatimonadota bacterium]
MSPRTSFLTRPRRLPSPLVLAAAGHLLLLGCGGGGETPPDPDGTGGAAAAADTDGPAAAEPEDTPAADRFVTGALEPVGGSRDEIRTSLGEPDSIGREPVANRHVPDQTDTIVTLHYPELVATLYAATGGDDLLQSVRVTDDAHLRDPAIRIGMPWEEARRRLGDPHEMDGEVPVYVCRSCTGAENPVRIHVADGLIQAIEFTYYVD